MKAPKHIGIVLALLVLIVQAILLPRVGMSWDEPSSFFVGRANLKFWMTGNRAYLNDLQNKELFKDSPIPYIYGEDIYPPFMFTISSAISYVFAEKLHLMGVYDAHHLGEVVVGAVGVWAIYGLSTASGLSVPVAAITTITYALYPTIFGAMRNDAKDIPLVSLLAVAAYFFVLFFKSWQAKRHRMIWLWGLLFALTLGFAQATKPTAVIIVPIIAVWLIASLLRSRAFRTSLSPFGPFFMISLVAGVVALGAMVLAWPWLWDDPVGKLKSVFSFFKTVGYNMPVPYFGTIYHAGITVPKTYPFVILLLQTPVAVTFCVGLGTVYSVWQYVRNKRVWPMLFVIWFYGGMSRFLFPGFIIYAFVRHFIDVVPAFFVLMGFGIETIALGAETLAKEFAVTHTFRFRRIALIVMAIVFVVHEAAISVQLFPYEMSYFNVLVGGISNVARLGMFDVGQGAGVKEAMEYIGKTTTQPTLVYPCLMGHLAMFYLPPNVGLTKATESGQYMLVPNSLSWFEGALTYSRKFHKTAYTIRRGGADLFYVYEYTRPSGWRCGWETKTSYEY